MSFLSFIFRSVPRQFESMYRPAFLLLRICLSLILASLCALYIHIDSDPHTAFELHSRCGYIKDCVLTAFVLSFGGSFVLDYEHRLRSDRDL